MQTDTIQTIPAESAAGARVLPIACAIVAAGLIAYFNSFFGQFVYDDAYIVSNAERLWPPTQMWSDASAVLWATFSVNYVLGGLNPVGYHAVNLAIHIAASLVLFGVLRRTLLLGRFGGRFDRSAAILAGSISLLWVVHPLNTQAVTYVIQRRESLMGLMYLLTLYAAVRAFHSRGARAWLVVSIAACCLGMRCKPVMVTAPVMVLLYDRVFIERSLGSLIRKRGLFYGALALSWLLLWPNAPRLAASGSGVQQASVTMWDYAMTQFGVILRYLSLTFWPAGQCLEYHWPLARSASQIAGPAIAVCMLVGLTIWALVRRPAWGYLGAWFFVILAPTSSFIVIAFPIFEHRMYLSLAAVVAVVVIGGFLLGSKLCDRMSISPARRGAAGLAIVVVLAAALTAATINRNTRYYSPVWMWADVLDSYPNSVRANYNYAASLADAGYVDQAAGHYRRAIELSPGLAKAHNNLGFLLAGKGRHSQAIEHYNKAIESDPEMVAAHHNLGLAFAAENLLEKAEASYRRALSIRSDYPQARNSLGALLYRRGRYAQAVAEYRLALKADPQFAEAMSNLARLLSACPDDKFRNGRKAMELAGQACRLTDYRSPEFLAVLSAAQAEDGRYDAAIRTARAALRLIDPGIRRQTALQIERFISQYRKSRPWRDDSVD